MSRTPNWARPSRREHPPPELSASIIDVHISLHSSSSLAQTSVLLIIFTRDAKGSREFTQQGGLALCPPGWLRCSVWEQRRAEPRAQRSCHGVTGRPSTYPPSTGNVLCPPELVFKLVCIVPGCPYVALIKMNPLDRLYKDSRCTLQA